MASSDRQNRLLVAEDWKKVYQSFKNADFKNYDFDNLRRTMINYLRQNYPNDFNDYIDSSEYVALIELIAFLGQNLAFRIDLNARENYLELAERRESILRLARLLSYNVKRNVCASGLLKMKTVSTTERVLDSNNLNLQRQVVIWNDSTNANWYEQFIKILNRALPVNNIFGKPVKTASIDSIDTSLYKLNSIISGTPIFSFSRTVNGKSLNFELVPANFTDVIYEDAPNPTNNFSLLFRDDGKGYSSSNTGFFGMFKQGVLQSGEFTIGSPTPNQIVNIDSININNTDLWLYKLDSNKQEQELWTKVENLAGNNIIYNSLSKKIRNIYAVLSRIDDRVSLAFADGVFGTIPQGNFRTYYRTSSNANLIISPNDFYGISVDIAYLSRENKKETLSITFELNYTVTNSSQTESNANIKANAPATYYTQNRLVTAEDYQIGPLVSSEDIIKVKSVNRISSGISRYFDLLDATGKYSETSLFGTDGILYYESYIEKSKFEFSNKTDIEGVIVNQIEPMLSKANIRNFYFNAYPKIITEDLNVSWVQLSKETNLCTGYLQNLYEVKQLLGTYTTAILKLVLPGSSVKFEAPPGKHFTPKGELQDGEANYPGALRYNWVKIVNVVTNGTEVQADNTGPVLLNDVIPTGARLVEIKPTVAKFLEDDVKAQIVDQVFDYNLFALRFDRILGQWRLIEESNLNLDSDFSIGKTGDVTNQKLDASWLIKFSTDGESYSVEARNSRYIFESDKEIKFYYDSSDKIYNSLTGKIVKDKISVLSVNTKPDDITGFTTDLNWEIVKEFRDSVGYVNTKKIEVSFTDFDEDGVVDNPEIFQEIVQPATNTNSKIMFFEKLITSDGAEDFNYVNYDVLGVVIKQNKQSVGPLSIYDDGQLFYFIDENIFETLDKRTTTLVINGNYKAYLGRDKLKFHYVHAADSAKRIDPSVSNIIDVYVATRDYDNQFRQWIDGTISSKPLPMSADKLYSNYGSLLNDTKSLSDELIYHPVKYRVLFGTKADAYLQAKFAIVKNTAIVLNDNDIKSRIITLINQYFALDNWDFGETFYFTDLSSYIMKEMAPDIVNLAIVPQDPTQVFGSLFEIKSEVDEIFVNGATVQDLMIVDAFTANVLRANGNVVSSITNINTGIQSS